MNATEFLESPQVQAWCDKQKKYRSMSAREYSVQLAELIEYAGTELNESESNKVLGEAFGLIWKRLGIKIDAKCVIPSVEG